MLNPFFLITVLVIALIIVLLANQVKSNKKSKKVLIEKMWNLKEISDDTYQKYLKTFQ